MIRKSNGITTLAAVVSLTVLLASCAIVPSGEEPETPTESESSGPAADQSESTGSGTRESGDDAEQMSDRFETEDEARQARAEAEAEREAAERAEEEAAEREAAERAEEQAAEREAAEQAAAQEAERAEASARAEREAAEREAAEAAARAEAEREAAERAEREEAEAQAQREAAEQAATEEAAGAAEAEAQAEAQAEAEAEAEEATTAQAGDGADEGADEADSAADEDEPGPADRADAEMASADAGDAVEAAEDPIVADSDADTIIPRTEENIARLGEDLTPMGSIRAGNEDGTIPAWDGGLRREDWPEGYQVGDRHPDPFADDEPLFTITGENYQEYSDRLSAGQVALFERYPETYFMKVYPSRRSASFPERIYEATIDNASTGRLVAEGEGVTDVYEGFPFPLAQNAYELMWNHKLKYKGIGGARYNNQVVPTSGGNFQLIKLREELLGLYYQEGMRIEDTNNILLYFFQEVESPARLAGNILLVHETLNQLEQPRQAWIYNPGQRRVRRAPNVAYDNPGTASDGLRTNDMTDMFNGAMDRYNWEVVGKKEMYIPYNSYAAHSGDITPDDLVRPGHLNPEHMRYELHRVWIVEADLKEGTRHIHPRRTFYLDEDSYQIALTDHYDQRGELWRVSEAHTINYYELPTYWSSILSHMDLQSGRYVATGLDNQDPVPSFNVELSPSNYTPQALRTRGRR